MKNNTTDTKKPSRQEKVQALSEDLEKSIHEFMNGEKYMAFLSSMSKFHTYSLNNQLLIARQRPGATCCASYTTWNRLNRQVRNPPFSGMPKTLRPESPVSYRTAATRKKPWRGSSLTSRSDMFSISPRQTGKHCRR